MTCRIKAMTEEDTITHLSGNFYSVGGVSSPMRTACGDSTYKNFEGRQHHQVKPGCFIKGRGVHVTGRNVTAGGEGNIEKRPFPRAWIEFIGRGKTAATVLKLYSPVDLPSVEDKLDEEEQLVIHDVMLAVILLFLISLAVSFCILAFFAIRLVWKKIKARRDRGRGAHNGGIEYELGPFIA